MIGMMRLYKKVLRLRSSAIEGIILGSPPEVPELQIKCKKHKFIRNIQNGTRDTSVAKVMKREKGTCITSQLLGDR